MNKTALKNFATWSRRKLIEQVQTKAFLYGIDEKNGLHLEEQFGQLVINGQTYPLSMKASFTALQKQLEQKGYKQLLEEVAYTWFNRIIAIRYMEVHEYLPEKVNVLSSSVGRVDPDILFEFDTMDLAIDEAKVRELVNTGDTEAAFRLLFVAQCNALNTILPFMFEKIQDYTELLLPDFLLDAESVIKTLVQSEELTESFEEIEVIGWLYQYYIAEEKDRVFAQKSKYKKEEIPFATQLFTPKWIVQYMVQNSLGRYWTEAHREDEDLIDKWEYFIKHEEEDFHEKIAPYVNKELKVEDIKLLDPAMGSGHILVYAFEVFHEIYEKCGYPEREIPRLILENNLYGLDIDDRAYQLASFAVVMKAASYSKRFLRSVEREGITLNLASIQETNHVSDDVIAYIAQQEVGEQYNEVKAFFEQYHNAKTYGSLINITKREIRFIEERLDQIVNNPVEDLFYGEQHEIAKHVLPELICQTKIMRIEYDVVVMNPPYMGNVSMNKELGDFLKKNYPSSKTDLYAAFMEIYHYLKMNSLYGAINQQSWMFIGSFKELRSNILDYYFLDSMIHLGSRAFEELTGEKVQTTSFVFRNYKIDNQMGKYIRLTEVKNSKEKQQSFFYKVKNEQIKIHQNSFKLITGKTLAYWITPEELDCFKEKNTFENIAVPRKGLDTNGDGELYFRRWYEVNSDDIYRDSTKNKHQYKWFEIDYGGSYRKWYGNREDIIRYDNNGELLKSKGKRPNIRNEEYYFKDSITYSVISSKSISFRRSFETSLFYQHGANCFPKKEELNYILALANSKIINQLLKYIAPTLSYTVGDIAKIPVKYVSKDTKKTIDRLVDENIELSKKDWALSETNIDFINHPALEFYNLCELESVYDKFKNVTDERRNLLIKNEEILNSIFIELYQVGGLYKETVTEDEITLHKASKENFSKTLLSYFVGVLLGRYSLPEKFDGEFRSLNQGIILLTEKKYLENDIYSKLEEFLVIIFGEENLNANIGWIAEALEDDSDHEKIIRKYFNEYFFADHCKLYQNNMKQKLPIYWLVESGKQKSLRTIIYMHRYTPSTMATIRFEHLQEIQAKYQQEIADLENRLVNPNLSATDKKKLNAEKVSFEKKIDELREFDKRLAAIAAEEIEIDLDDGVKVNYEKFYRGGKGVLAKIK